MNLYTSVYYRYTGTTHLKLYGYIHYLLFIGAAFNQPPPVQHQVGDVLLQNQVNQAQAANDALQQLVCLFHVVKDRALKTSTAFDHRHIPPVRQENVKLILVWAIPILINGWSKYSKAILKVLTIFSFSLITI